jgi:sugar (pentulose or hexulose) kinase
MAQDLIGVIDIGKTNTRLTLIEAQSGKITFNTHCPSKSVDGPLRQLDIAGIEHWLMSSLTAAPGKERIKALVPIAHGAAAVLLDANQKVLSAPDYEDPALESVAEAYRPLRDGFEKSYSPFLPLGLNLGRQLYYLQTQTPELFAQARQLLLYPQYWSWRLSGVAASELTSLGCHTDLWRPLEKRATELAERQGWSALLPPLRKPNDSLGTITPALVAATGLTPACRVACGIHDSNASFLCHLLSRPTSAPFAAVSSGTWTVIMAHGVELGRLCEPLDMLLNIDALGRPTATARFMGGREYEAIAGPDAVGVVADRSDLEAVIARRAMALPSFADAGGPFVHQKGQLLGVENLSLRQRAALATVYTALVTDYLLEFLSVQGDVVVDGPLAENALYTEVLAALRPDNSVRVGNSNSSRQTVGRYLAGFAVSAAREAGRIEPIVIAGLTEYRRNWRGLLSSQDPGNSG